MAWCHADLMLTLCLLASAPWLVLSKSWRKSFQATYADRITHECKKLWTLDNAIIVDGRYSRGFECVPGYQPNVPLGTYFKCKKSEDYDNAEWVWVDTKDRVNLTDVRCERRRQCPPPPVVANGFPSVADGHSLYAQHFPKLGYFSGDVLTYECNQGYEFQTTTSSSDDFYDYYKFIDFNETDTNQPNIAIECTWDQEWNTTDIATCDEIFCDTNDLPVVTHGYIELGNISEFRQFDTVTLECEQGYRPVEDIDSISCLTSSSFKRDDFGCEAILCPSLPGLENGWADVEGYTVNATVEFYCESGYQLHGKQTWTCQEDGTWDEYCVTCDRGDTYCPVPCVPEGAQKTSGDEYGLGDTVKFVCEDGESYGGSPNRTCLRNRRWSGTPLDCTGSTIFDKQGVAAKLKASMLTIKALNTSAASNSSLASNTSADYNDTAEWEATERMIEINQEGGVDLFIMMDISESISEPEFDKSMEFIKALLKNVGLSNKPEGTRLALYAFAGKANIVKGLNDHFKKPHQLPKNYEQIRDRIDSIKYQDVTKQVGKGTSIYEALQELYKAMETKRLPTSRSRKDADNVVILITDGEITQDGNPTELANAIKNEFQAQIYVIAVGDKKSEWKKIEKLASPDEPGDKHFIAVEKRNLLDVAKQMIDDRNASITCGEPKMGDTHLNLPDREEAEAAPHTWHWMAQITDTGNNHICGGSLIAKKWILTAAHCLHGKFEATNVYLKRHDRNDDVGVLRYNIQLSIAHEKYDKTVTPSHDYDIALLKLNEPVTFDNYVQPVCLWTDDLEVRHGGLYETLFQPETPAVVTGWGALAEDTRTPATLLQQKQVYVQSVATCTTSLKQEANKFNNATMICAGNEIGNGQWIDACQGDSGGPLVVNIGRQDSSEKFVQTAIVSWGVGCRRPDRYGIYTKLNKPLLNWIKAKMAENP